MIHKFAIVYIIALLVGSTGIAQQHLSLKEQQQLKKEVQLKAETTETITADFIQTKNVGMLRSDIISEGTLVFKAPDKILWKYVSPTTYSVLFRDEMLYVNTNGKKEKINLSSNKIFRSLNDLIVQSIRGDMFNDEAFEISYMRVPEYYEARFVPKDRRLLRHLASFELKFDLESKEVSEVRLNEPNGDFTIIEFKNRKTNTSIPSRTFTN